MRTPEGITIERQLPRGAERRAAELYWAAFGRKLGRALGPPARGTDFVAAHLNRDRAVVALADNLLVGLAGYHHAGRAFAGGSPRDVLDAYGWVSGLPRLPLLAVLARSPAPGEMVMDGIAVEHDFRGRGIGTLLLEEVVAVGAELGYRRVRLDVVDTNPRARALYERRGFVPGRTQFTPYLQPLMGFAAVTTMRRSTC